MYVCVVVCVVVCGCSCFLVFGVWLSVMFESLYSNAFCSLIFRFHLNVKLEI